MADNPTTEDGFYWVTRFLYDRLRLVAPDNPSPEVARLWKGRWLFAGENAEDCVWKVHSGKLEEPNV